nr:uncharacterized protein LOC114924098 [Arachis hypogaea]
MPQNTDLAAVIPAVTHDFNSSIHGKKPDKGSKCNTGILLEKLLVRRSEEEFFESYMMTSHPHSRPSVVQIHPSYDANPAMLPAAFSKQEFRRQHVPQGMANVVQEPGIVSDPTQIDVKLFNRWSFDDVQVTIITRNQSFTDSTRKGTGGRREPQVPSSSRRTRLLARLSLHCLHSLQSSPPSLCRIRGLSLLRNHVLARAEDKARGSSTSSQQQFQIDVACGNHGATNGMALGKGYVNVSTVDVDTSKLISERIKSTGALFLEAPVSGSKKPAEDGQLIFLTAGEGIQAPFHGRVGSTFR